MNFLFCRQSIGKSSGAACGGSQLVGVAVISAFQPTGNESGHHGIPRADGVPDGALRHAQPMDAALLIPIPTRYGKKEFLDAQEIANGICFLASPQASGINGVILFIDGGIDALLRSERF